MKSGPRGDDQTFPERSGPVRDETPTPRPQPHAFGREVRFRAARISRLSSTRNSDLRNSDARAVEPPRTHDPKSLCDPMKGGIVPKETHETGEGDA